MKDKDIATLTGIVYNDETSLAPDAYYFMLRKGDIEFAISLSDVVDCLLFAEENNLLPHLQDNWRDLVQKHFE